MDTIQAFIEECARRGEKPHTIARKLTNNPRFWQRLPFKIAEIERDLDRLRRWMDET